MVRRPEYTGPGAMEALFLTVVPLNMSEGSIVMLCFSSWCKWIVNLVK